LSLKKLLARYVNMVPSPNGIIVQLRLGPNTTKEQFESWLGEEGAMLGLMHAPEKVQLRNKPPARKGGNLSNWAAMRCKEPAFWGFLQSKGLVFDLSPNPSTNESAAVKAIYRVCGVKSRSDLDHPEHKPAADIFKAEFIRPYAEYLKG